jgi:hypothetical protein
VVGPTVSAFVIVGLVENVHAPVIVAVWSTNAPYVLTAVRIAL